MTAERVSEELHEDVLIEELANGNVELLINMFWLDRERCLGVGCKSVEIREIGRRLRLGSPRGRSPEGGAGWKLG